MIEFNELLKMNKEDMSLEDLFIIVFCMVDKYYRLIVGSPSNLRGSNNSNPEFSDQEVLTIALVGELNGEDSQRGWWRYVHKNYHYLFPALCSRTRYGRRLKRLRRPLELMRQQWLYQLDATLDSYRIVDSYPVRLLKLFRLQKSSCPFEYAAMVGYNSTHKEYFYGLKAHLLSDLRGIAIAFVFTPANPHDQKGFLRLLEELVELGISHVKLIVVGDKAYVGKEYLQLLKEDYGIEILPIQKQYNKKCPESRSNRILSKTRGIIETTISILTEHMNANWTRCRSLAGFTMSMLTKLAALNLANLLNYIMGEPLLQIKGFAK